MKVLIRVSFVGDEKWINPCGLLMCSLDRIDGLLKWKIHGPPIYDESFSGCLKKLDLIELDGMKNWQVVFLNRVHKQYDTFLLPNLYIDFIDGDLDHLLTWDEYESLLQQ